MPVTIRNAPAEDIQRLGMHAMNQAQVKTMMSGESLMDKIEPKLISKHVPTWVGEIIKQNGIERKPQETPAPAPAAAPALPNQLGPFNSGSITFNNGVPVGGWMSLTLYDNGNYVFNGHFHDSGAPSYDIDAVWVIVSKSGKAFTFTAKGKTHGTFDSGSRNFDFNSAENNPDIKNLWSDLCDGYHWRWSSNVNWDVANALNNVLDAIKAAGTIISAVITVVALV